MILSTEIYQNTHKSHSFHHCFFLHLNNQFYHYIAFALSFQSQQTYTDSIIEFMEITVTVTVK